MESREIFCKIAIFLPAESVDIPMAACYDTSQIRVPAENAGGKEMI